MFYLITQIWLHLLLAFALGAGAAWWWLTRRAGAGAGEAAQDAPLAPESSLVDSLRLQLEAARAEAKAARDALVADRHAAPRPRALEPRLPDALVDHAEQQSPVRAADDLTRIRGVGPVLERKLNDLGIRTFREIAGWSSEDVERIQAQLERFPGEDPPGRLGGPGHGAGPDAGLAGR